MGRKTADSPSPRLWPSTRRILFLAGSGTQILDVVGPYQIFVRASEILQRKDPARPPAYRVELASTTGQKVVLTNCGLRLIAARTYRAVKGPVDTLLIAGGTLMEKESADRILVRWVQRRASAARRVGSICTGAFLLARAGLLNGKRAVTHWRWCERLARCYPEIQVDPEPIFIRDGNVVTSAGVTAGMDLALSLVEEDFDAGLALEVAREMVLYLRRPGGQSQFSAALSLQASGRGSLDRLHAWIRENVAGDLSVPELARRVAMSPRNFARVFLRETGTTPARYVERFRVEAACQRLEETGRGLDEIASDCGLSSAESMRRVFHRVLGVTPGEYRARFRRIPASAKKRGRQSAKLASGRRSKITRRGVTT